MQIEPGHAYAGKPFNIDYEQQRADRADQQLDRLLAAIETVESRWGQPAVRIDESLKGLYMTAMQIRRERDG